MASVKLYLDTRRARQDGSCPLKLSLSHKNKTALISLDVYVAKNQWNGREVVDHPRKRQLNVDIENIKLDILAELLSLKRHKKLGSMTIQDLREHIENFLNPKEESKPVLFLEKYREYMNSRSAQRTREIYDTTLKHIIKFDPEAEILTFENISKRWLDDFKDSMKEESPSINARNIHLRNIRAVFNAAIDDNITKNYPFRKYKIKNKQTAKRSISRDMVHTLFNYIPQKPHQQKYLDIFKLIFYLIGINIKDLCHLKPGDFFGGFISYNRFKGGKYYQIKVEPEAEEIINKYRGKKWLLDILDRNKNYKNYAKNLNTAMKDISDVLGYPKLTTYWMRHTWATLAAELDIPKETIAASLGHGTEKVTDVYIRFDLNKVYEANRKVIDYIKDIEEQKK